MEFIGNITHSIKDFLLLFPSGTFPFLAVSIGLPTIILSIHKKLKVVSGNLKIFISLLVSALTVLLPMGLGLIHANITLFGAYGGEVFTVASLVYQFWLKEKPELEKDLNIDLTIPEQKIDEIQPPAPKFS